MEKLSSGVINDNSKRSISIRISTSDYGRIKAISRRLRVREAEVFRFIVKVGLSEVAPLSYTNSTVLDLLSVFAAHGDDLVGHFNLDALRLNRILNPEGNNQGPRIDVDDLELLAMTTLPERILVLRLQELVGHPIEPTAVLSELQRYLTTKYSTPPPRLEVNNSAA